MQKHNIFKTLILSLLMSMGGMQGVAAKAVTTSSFSIAAGETREWFVYMTTVNTTLVSFQMELTLPEGLSLNVDKCSLTSRVLDGDQQLFIGPVGERHYRLISTSFSFTPLTTDNAPLVKLSFTADKNYKGGQATLHDMIMVNTSGNSGVWGDELFDVAVVPAVKGDVDFNQEVDVTDTMLLVDYTMGKDKLYSSAMDINKDGVINVSDVMGIVHLILNK